MLNVRAREASHWKISLSLDSMIVLWKTQENHLRGVREVLERTGEFSKVNGCKVGIKKVVRLYSNNKQLENILK